MKKLTRKQVKEMYGFYNRNTQVLHNGEVGYCKAIHTVIVCCGNCGDYSHVKIKGLTENKT